MGNFTFEEMNLMCIYITGSRTGLIDSLCEMRGELSPEETELRELTDSALTKLCAMTDEKFAELELSSFQFWGKKMGRYVRRSSKGIALVDDSGDRPRLRYVFDISDTGTREHSRTPWLWQLEERHLDSVQAMLERTYDVSGDDLAGQLTEVAGKLAEEYWTEHQQDFFYIVDGSFLEEYDEFNIGVQFKAAANVSITYALMSRCGLEPERYFDHEDFMAISMRCGYSFSLSNIWL